jgi:hypothetical protein
MQRPAEIETELGRYRLPVSRRLVVLRQPRGAEDLLMLETAPSPSGDAALALALAERLTRPAEGDALDWESLSVTDLDTLIVRLRQALVGDHVRTDIACLAPKCGKRIDIEFGLDDFLAHHLPRAGGRSEPAAEPGWFRLAVASEVGPICFRLPTAADQIAATDSADPAKELARRCIRPSDLAGRLRRRAEAAMEALAPSLSSDLQGTCPECGTTVSMYFDARWFCLRELRDRAAFTYQDVDVLARRYHWTETDILALPRVRRSAYAELARQTEGT